MLTVAVGRLRKLCELPGLNVSNNDHPKILPRGILTIRPWRQLMSFWSFFTLRAGSFLWQLDRWPSQ